MMVQDKRLLPIILEHINLFYHHYLLAVLDTEGYLKKTVTETTVGLEHNKLFEINLSIDPIKKEIILPRIE
jgi:hypothetical protein